MSSKPMFNEGSLHSPFQEIQQEKDILQERMSEQLMKISSLQTRLDEQRIRAEELNKQSNSDLTLRVHDLQSELSNLKETLVSREKQISNLNNLLEQSKKIIDRQEHELALNDEEIDGSTVDKMQDELIQKDELIKSLKHQIKTETIQKVALPDLMGTMMAEKDEEIDILRRQLKKYESSFEQNNSSPPTTNMSGTILRSIPEYDEPEQLRRMLEFSSGSQQFFRIDTLTTDFSTNKATLDSSSQVSLGEFPASANLIPKRIMFSSGDESSVMHGMMKVQNDLELAANDRMSTVEHLQRELIDKINQIAMLEANLQEKTKLYDEMMNEKLQVENEIQEYKKIVDNHHSMELNMKKKEEELTNSVIKIKKLEQNLAEQNQELQSLKALMDDKDVRIQNINAEIEISRKKCLENEQMLRELERLRKQVSSYNNTMEQKECILKKLEHDIAKYMTKENELLEKAQLCDRLLGDNSQLKSDVDYLRRELSLKTFALEKCKIDLQDAGEKFDCPRSDDDYDEGAGGNLSVAEIAAKLEQELSYSEKLDENLRKAIESESEINSELDEIGSGCGKKYHEKMKKLQDELQSLKNQYQRITAEFEDEKKNFDLIQMQDASLIEAIRIRLEAALDNENVLKKLLDAEKHKTESLSSQLTGVQRTKSFDNYLLFNKNQYQPESSRRQLRLNEFESEVVMRLESEIKILTAQNERERERVLDLQKILDNERDRFSKTLEENQVYSDQMKKEIKKLLSNKEKLEEELEKLQSLKMKLFEAESEKNRLTETIKSLRSGSQILNKRSDSFTTPKDNRDEEKFMEKLKEINKNISENAKENHQMAETLHFLTEERRMLQHRITELESSNYMTQHHAQYNHDLEERANHLFAKYMRCESFRKALIFQKKFLLISYEVTNKSMPLFKTDPSKKRKSFRSVALMVIAIERMKYISRRWTGKRMNAKAIFSAYPRRSQSASNNNWAKFDSNFGGASSGTTLKRINSTERLVQPPERPAGFQLSPNFMKAPLHRLFET